MLNGYQGVELLEKIQDLSAVMVAKWRGLELTSEDQELVDEVYNNLDIGALNRPQRRKMGKTAIQIA